MPEMTAEQLSRIAALRFAIEEGFRAGLRQPRDAAIPLFYQQDDDCQRAAALGFELAGPYSPDGMARRAAARAAAEEAGASHAPDAAPKRPPG